MTKAEFSKIVKLLVELFPQGKEQFTKAVAETWYRALSDLEYRRVDEGVLLYAQENQWLPSIAEIRKYANKIPKYTEEEIDRMIERAKEKEREQGDPFGF